MLFGGERRYLSSHPDQYLNLSLFPNRHPSSRHSVVDWSDSSTWDNFPDFSRAKMNEVVLQAGDVYIYQPIGFITLSVSISTFDAIPAVALAVNTCQPSMTVVFLKRTLFMSFSSQE